MKDLSADDLIQKIPLAARRPDRDRTIVRVKGAAFGDGGFAVIAGPCAVESRDQVLDIARHVKRAGAVVLRGGAFKPLTFPYRDDRTFERGDEGLTWLAEAGRAAGLPVVTEVTDVRKAALVAEHADILQIGARNMQNFPLLEELGQIGKPVLLKRHFGCSLRDWLGAAEYVLYQGNPNVILCERGIVAPHTHQMSSRFLVDIQVIPAAHEATHLPVLVDPSHSTFKREYVAPVSRAALAVGADGIILDVHPTPEKAAVDPLQALSYPAFETLMNELRAMGAALGRPMVAAS